MISFRIDYLVDFPDAIVALVPGLLEHWRTITPEQTAANRVEKFQAHMNRELPPIAWVARAGQQILGTAALRVHDLEGREDLTPWLGGVFVLPEFRRGGVASALCLAVEEKARLLGFRRLFLFTLDQQGLYRRLGWGFAERVIWRGHQSDIMFKNLSDGPQV